MQLNVIVSRIPNGFSATDGSGHIGCGNTMAEAIGCLVLTCPNAFDVNTIKYDNDYATRVYVIERGLNAQIITKDRS